MARMTPGQFLNEIEDKNMDEVKTFLHERYGFNPGRPLDKTWLDGLPAEDKAVVVAIAVLKREQIKRSMLWKRLLFTPRLFRKQPNRVEG